MGDVARSALRGVEAPTRDDRGEGKIMLVTTCVLVAAVCWVGILLCRYYGVE